MGDFVVGTAFRGDSVPGGFCPRRILSVPLLFVCYTVEITYHGNGIPNGNGNPMGFPWEWELVTKLGMEMGRNGKQPVWEWEWPLFPWESIPIGGYSYVIVQFIET